MSPCKAVYRYNKIFHIRNVYVMTFLALDNIQKIIMPYLSILKVYFQVPLALLLLWPTFPQNIAISNHIGILKKIQKTVK